MAWTYRVRWSPSDPIINVRRASTSFPGSSAPRAGRRERPRRGSRQLDNRAARRTPPVRHRPGCRVSGFGLRGGAPMPGGRLQRTAAAGAPAVPRSGAASIHIRSDSAVDQIRVFRMTLREKPTVLHTGNQNAPICGNSRRDPYLGTYRARSSRVNLTIIQLRPYSPVLCGRRLPFPRADAIQIGGYFAQVPKDSVALRDGAPVIGTGLLKLLVLLLGYLISQEFDGSWGNAVADQADAGRPAPGAADRS